MAASANIYEEVVLLEQVFVIDGETKIAKVVENAAKAAGAPVAWPDFARFALGEGIQKEHKDFAAEVATRVPALFTRMSRCPLAAATRSTNSRCTPLAAQIGLHDHSVAAPLANLASNSAAAFSLRWGTDAD